jgi:hypothetical protein
MRKLSMLFATLAVFVGLASTAGAATVTLTSGTLSIGIGALPPIALPFVGSVPILVSSGNGSFTEPANVFGPANIPLPRQLFTGTPQISGLTLAGFANGTKVFNGTNGTAVGGLNGKAIVNVLQLLNLSIPLNVVGNPGATVQAGVGAIIITVVAQGWTTGTAVVTGLPSPTPTATAQGTDARTPGHGGTIVLVSGFQAITNVAGTLPGFATQVLNFAGAPEPGTLLLLGSGVAGLAILGRRRMRK